MGEVSAAELSMRNALIGDLPALKEMYRGIVAAMAAQGLNIWDDVYPVEFLADDISKGNLYLFERAGRLVAACALSLQGAYVGELGWSGRREPALYLDRFGVAVDAARQGIATQALSLVEAWARGQDAGVEYLRMFVACANTPAISLYETCGYSRVAGIYREVFEDGSFLEEFGYEKRLETIQPIR